MIQSIITWLIVAASVGIVIRSVLKGIRGKEGCSCYFCGDNSCVYRNSATCSMTTRKR